MILNDIRGNEETYNAQFKILQEINKCGVIDDNDFTLELKKIEDRLSDFFGIYGYCNNEEGVDYLHKDDINKIAKAMKELNRVTKSQNNSKRRALSNNKNMNGKKLYSLRCMIENEEVQFNSKFSQNVMSLFESVITDDDKDSIDLKNVEFIFFIIQNIFFMDQTLNNLLNYKEYVEGKSSKKKSDVELHLELIKHEFEECCSDKVKRYVLDVKKMMDLVEEELKFITHIPFHSDLVMVAKEICESVEDNGENTKNDLVNDEPLSIDKLGDSQSNGCVGDPLTELIKQLVFEEVFGDDMKSEWTEEISSLRERMKGVNDICKTNLNLYEKIYIEINNWQQLERAREKINCYKKDIPLLDIDFSNIRNDLLLEDKFRRIKILTNEKKLFEYIKTNKYPLFQYIFAKDEGKIKNIDNRYIKSLIKDVLKFKERKDDGSDILDERSRNVERNVIYNDELIIIAREVLNDKGYYSDVSRKSKKVNLDDKYLCARKYNRGYEVFAVYEEVEKCCGYEPDEKEIAKECDKVQKKTLAEDEINVCYYETVGSILMSRNDVVEKIENLIEISFALFPIKTESK